MKDIICYGGDSFTWGEGLELYIDSPFWINERNNLNTWTELGNKQTDGSQKFRESNRFAGLVSTHFNTDSLVMDYNGGGFDGSIRYFDKHLKQIPKAYVYQFTTFPRFNLHFTTLCKCGFCSSKLYNGVRPYAVYLEAVNKRISDTPLNDAEIYYLTWLEKYENIQFNNIDLDRILDSLVEQFTPLFLKSMNIFLNNWVSEWEKTSDVYFIDSWDYITSDILDTIPEIKSKMIPLKGYDSNWYYKWKEWEETFPHKRIQYEFPVTENGHPTLLQHRYIAESIIQAMEK